jgi:2,5-diamino-6-(ribosylamino)-4(3H)-pyrimidinone 5'-phosphate reductase
MTERKKALEDAGARIIEIPPSSILDDLFSISLPVVLKSLHDLGIRSLMVEGGARIIGSFFAASGKIVDALIITVAPILVGSDGVGYQCKYPVFDLGDSKKQASFKEVHTELIGKDTVVSLECTMKDS